MERKGSRPLYVMDDDYIEQKYVRAEEERQRQEELERQRRQQEEVLALVQAEEQRKKAESDRIRQEQEDNRVNQLKRVKEEREAAERLRREKEEGYQAQLDRIELNLRTLNEEKSAVVDERMQISTNMREEENLLRKQLETITREKNVILEKEQAQKLKLRTFEEKFEVDMKIFRQKEELVKERIKKLTDDRRNLQTDLLNLLQSKSISTTQTAPPIKIQPAPVAQNSLAYPSMGQTPHSNTGAQYTPYGATQPQTQSHTPPVQQQTQASNALNDQLATLQSFFDQGILNQEEFNDAKAKAIEDSKQAPTAPAPTPQFEVTPVPSYAIEPNAHIVTPAVQPAATHFPAQSMSNDVQAQISQLDNFLREGILTQADYEDAKQKVLTDAGIAPAGQQMPSQPQQQSSQPKQQLVNVTVPPGMAPGMNVNIQVQGKLFSVPIPANLYPGMTFQASVPV